MSAPPQRAVLVADGDAAICSLLAAVVQRLDLRPVVARHAEVARQLLATEEFEAAVIDLQLPGMGGEEVVSLVARVKPELVPRTIVMVAMPLTQPADCSGVAAVLRKPFALDELIVNLRQCCTT